VIKIKKPPRLHLGFETIRISAYEVVNDEVRKRRKSNAPPTAIIGSTPWTTESVAILLQTVAAMIRKTADLL
jgi:hypothetical protein